MLSCMAGNESEAIKKSGIRGETKLFLGENGSYLERTPHFFVDFFVQSCKEYTLFFD